MRICRPSGMRGKVPPSKPRARLIRLNALRLDELRRPGGLPDEQRESYRLAGCSRFFQNVANVRANCILRDAAGSGDSLNCVSGGEAAGDACLGGGEIE
jgi:hypothetical protein